VCDSQRFRVSVCLRSDLSTADNHIFYARINFYCVIIYIREHESPVLVVQLYPLENNRDEIMKV
jgi:hypothetical protein